MEPDSDDPLGTQTQPLRPARSRSGTPAAPRSFEPAASALPPQFAEPPALDPTTEREVTATWSLRGVNGLDVARPAAVPTVRVETAIPADLPEPVAPTAAEPEDVLCPRCEGGTLIDPESLGLCTRCGFCRSLEEGRGIGSTYRSSSLGLTEFARLLVHLPAWSWVLIVGTAAVVCYSLAIDWQLPTPGRERAVWSVAQFVSGFTLLAVAQWWALVRVAPSDARLGPRDLVVVSGRLWGVAFERLPATRWQVWLGVWGVVMMACAALVIGGWSYWFAAA